MVFRSPSPCMNSIYLRAITHGNLHACVSKPAGKVSEERLLFTCSIWTLTCQTRHDDLPHTHTHTNLSATMESHFDFYSFSGYEILISIIQFSLVKMVNLDIRNWISTSNNVFFISTIQF